MTRNELIQRLWGNNTFVDYDQSLNKAINRLREALGDSHSSPRVIQTLPRRGYRLMSAASGHPSLAAPDIRSCATLGTPSQGGNGSHQSSSPVIADTSVTTAQPSTGRKHGKSLLVGASLAAIALVGSVAYIWSIRARSSHHGQDLEVSPLTNESHVGCIAVSPDGRYVAYELQNAQQSSLRIRQIGSRGDAEVLAGVDSHFSGLSFSPEGNEIYFVRADKNDPGFKYLYVMPTLGGAVHKLITDIDSPVSFAPDGSQFVFTRGIPTQNASELRIAKSNGSEERLLSRMSDTFAGHQPGAAWSPDGKVMAVSLRHFGEKDRYGIYIVSAGNGNAREFVSSDKWIGRAVWSHEGDAILAPMEEQASHRHQIWEFSYPSGRARKLTNGLTDYETLSDLTRNGEFVASVASKVVSELWVADYGRLTEPRQLTHGGPGIFNPLETQDGDLLVLTDDNEVWTLGADGSKRELFTDVPADTLDRCGNNVIVRMRRDGLSHILVLSAGGTDTKDLASGHLFSPVCSRTGDTAYYAEIDSPQRVMSVPAGGGPPKEFWRVLGDGVVGRLSISPNGRFLAVPFEQFRPVPTLNFAIIALDGSSPVRTLAEPGGIYNFGLVDWSPDNKSIQFVWDREGASNIWEQPITGGQPRPVTHFTAGDIFDFRWSNDGKHLYIAKGSTTSDAVLIRNL